MLLDKKEVVRFKRAIILDNLQRKAKKKTDLGAAWEMQKAKAKLFALFNKIKIPGSDS